MWQGAGHVARSAATVGLVAADPEDELHEAWMQYDLGQATAYMMLAAADRGLGSAHAAVRDQARAQRVLRFPDGYSLVYVIAFGYPADRPLTPIRNPDRRAFDDVVHWGRW